MHCRPESRSSVARVSGTTDKNTDACLTPPAVSVRVPHGWMMYVTLPSQRECEQASQTRPDIWMSVLTRKH